jgi:hypothetical protein
MLKYESMLQSNPNQSPYSELKDQKKETTSSP